MILRELAAMVLIGSGLVFFFGGVVALRRFPDSFCRLHALTKVDNVGLGLVMAGFVVHLGFNLLSAKLLVLYLVTLSASALNSFLIARSAYRNTAASREDRP